MSKRERPKLNWLPEWDRTVSGWAANFIKKNIWRCDRIDSFEDLMQDAYLVFEKVRRAYPKVTEPKHFMSLFQTSLRNSIHDRSRYMKRKKLVHEDTALDISELYAERIGEPTNYGQLQIIFNEMPEELHWALALMNNHPELLRTEGSKRENLNMRLRRLLGLPDGVFDFVGELKHQLKGSSNVRS